MGSHRKESKVYSSAKKEYTCECCGKTFYGHKRKYCSPQCRKQVSNANSKCIDTHGELTKVCPVCNKTFTTYRSRKMTCSTICSKRLHNFKSTNRKRIQYKDIIIDPDITLMRLAERDNYQCKICGLSVDLSDKKEGYKTIICGDMYPSIDHIIPISLGGMHSWDNVQLAHRICNSYKSNRFIG